jgi:hypothetical protein
MRTKFVLGLTLTTLAATQISNGQAIFSKAADDAVPAPKISMFDGVNAARQVFSAVGSIGSSRAMDALSPMSAADLGVQENAGNLAGDPASGVTVSPEISSPEPGAIALMALGGWTLLTGNARRRGCAA